MPKDKAEKQQYEVLDAAVDTHVGKIDLDLWSDDLDNGANMTIAYKKYDESAGANEPHFVDDDKTFEAANALMQEAFGMSIDEVIDNPALLRDAEVEAFPSEDGTRAFLTELRGFFKPDKIDTAMAKTIAKMPTPIFTTPVTETMIHGVAKESKKPYAMFQLEAGIEVEVKNETKVARISQFKIPSDDVDTKDAIVKTKYISGVGFDGSDRDGIATKWARIDEGEYDDDPERARKIERGLRAQIDAARDARSAQFVEGIGMSIDELIESGQGIPLQKVEINDSTDNIWIVGVIDVDAFPSK